MAKTQNLTSTKANGFCFENDLETITYLFKPHTKRVKISKLTFYIVYSIKPV